MTMKEATELRHLAYDVENVAQTISLVLPGIHPDKGVKRMPRERLLRDATALLVERVAILDGRIRRRLGIKRRTTVNNTKKGASR